MLSRLLPLFALLPLCANAAYFDLTRSGPEAQECITFDARYPYWTKAIYIATYPDYSRSKEGWNAPYYGGVVSHPDQPSQLIQFASWQMSGKGAPPSGIDFIHAGPHMSWQRSNWEGSSGGIKGMWPNADFKPGEWYRFYHRVWTPAAGTPHTGYAGVWMKNLKTGVWYHLATFKFPAELTGFNTMGGFTEFITGDASNACAVEFKNIYSRRDGKWVSDAKFSAYNHKQDTITLTQPADKSAVLLTTTRTKRDAKGEFAEGKVVTQTATLTQPEAPDFLDAAKVGSVSASGLGNRVTVSWAVEASAAPQLGYTVDILDGDKVVATAALNDPEARLAVVDLKSPPAGPVTARIRITDIFGAASEPVAVPVGAASVLAADPKPAATATGLAYRYFETDKPAEWKTLPDLSKLTPKRTGVVTVPDLTPRLKRTGYAFDYTGWLNVPADGLYAFNLIAACGAELTLDDTTVIAAGDSHSIAPSHGAVALRAGLHRFRLAYYQGERQMLQSDDFLQLRWSGPGVAEAPVPFQVFGHKAAADEPKVFVNARTEGAGGIGLSLAAKVTGASGKPAKIEYYATDPGFDYFAGQGAQGADYLLAANASPEKTVTATIWGGASRAVRARLIYDGNRTVDSAPVMLPPAPAKVLGEGAAWQLTALEHHLYPPAFSSDRGVVTLVGESMSLLTKPFEGDGTLTARLADITSGEPMPDGTEPPDAQNWFAGLILRDNLNPRPGEPLGGSQIPFTAILGTADKKTRHCDSTMINGAGNQPSGDVGGDHRWFRLERRGADFTTSISKDGKVWKVVKKVTLPKMSAKLEAGFVIYSIPASTPLVHWAKFDNISLKK